MNISTVSNSTKLTTINVVNTVYGFACSNITVGEATWILNRFHSSPLVPPSGLPALPFTELTWRINSTFLSFDGAIQSTSHIVWSLPASVCDTSLGFHD